MILTYRPATATDIPAMTAIRNSVAENSLSDPARITSAMYHDYLARLGRSWVCEADGVVAGYASADQADGSIWALFVDQAHEGRGIGQALLALAVEYLFAQGRATIMLSTAAGTRADRFYAAQGWQRGTVNQLVQVQYVLARPLAA